MDAALRPHRGGTVLALGALSLLIVLGIVALLVTNASIQGGVLLRTVAYSPPVFGVLAFVLGWRQVAGMRHLRIDPAGRTSVRRGQILGAVATVGWLGLAAYVVIQVGQMFSGTWNWTMDTGPGTRIHQSFHDGKVIEVEYCEARAADGSWVKDGPSTRWSAKANGVKLEQGSYHLGKRAGPWRFRHEDGSIDEERSGTYEDDVRIGPLPVGDFPVQTTPFGYTERP